MTPAVMGQSRQEIQFDSDWRFSLGDPSGAEKATFEDSNWRKLDVPHDWSIEGPFDQKNPTGAAGGFLPAGVGWYRKHFTLPESQAQRRVFVEFDGVMANSDVWINGVHLGRRPYGYVSFRYELTPHLNFGQTPNVIAVRVDNSGLPASRWYAGAGIYRHVRLTITNPVHIDHWGTFVTTRVALVWDDVVHVTAKVVDKNGVLVPTAINLVSFGVSGPGVVAAVDNGDNSSHEKFQASQRRA